jgi:murein DD-endopeptidase MepM/ murein hydrolase activator NlpD
VSMISFLSSVKKPSYYLSFLSVLAANAAMAAPAMIYIGQDTFLKTTTGQASGLPAASKCAFTTGQGLQISTVSDGGADHLRVTLPRAYTGCALTSGYLYSPHVSTNTTALTVNTATVFKKTTADSSSLPAASKCTMPAGVYPLSGAISTDGAHFKVNLKSFLPSCSFSLGYVFDGHASSGIQILSLTDSLYLKKSTADSSTLPAADKCLIAKANYKVTAAPGSSGDHYSVSLVSNPSGCAFRSGFVFYANTLLAQPGSPISNTGYTKPLANGFQGSAWCVCRNIGTSPHIGQDWNADGAENSVATANGTIVAKGFSASCGHTLTLRDAGGADWIYRHLNSNSIADGQSVTKGQFLGSHSSYPTSGCGSGAHLHIERRSAGAFNDREVFKSCEAGPEPCNFDPNKPFPLAKALIDSSALTLDSVAVAAPRKYCRANPDSYAEVSADFVANYSDAQSLVSAQAQREFYGEQAHLTVGVSINGNASNQCSKGAACLTALTALAIDREGRMTRVFHDSAVRNRPAAVVSEEQHCLPDNAEKILLLMRDQNGARIKTEVPLL